MQLIIRCSCMQLHKALTACTAVRSPQTVAYNVDVFALAGAQDTAVSIQAPAFDIKTYTDFNIQFTYVVCPVLPLVSTLDLVGSHAKKPCMPQECMRLPGMTFPNSCAHENRGGGA